MNLTSSSTQSSGRIMLEICVTALHIRPCLEAFVKGTSHEYIKQQIY